MQSCGRQEATDGTKSGRTGQGQGDTVDQGETDIIFNVGAGGAGQESIKTLRRARETVDPSWF